MEKIKATILFYVLLDLTVPSLGQNVGIGVFPVRAKLETNTDGHITSAIFGVESTGISFQRNYPTIGFNQYRLVGGPVYGTRIGAGYAALQHLNPSTGEWVVEMNPASGIANSTVAGEYYRAFTIFSNAGVCFGKGNFNSSFAVDHLNTLAGNIGRPGIYFQGTQYHSFLNLPGAVSDIVTNISPGKAGGTTFINDIPGGNVVIGAASFLASSQLNINSINLYLTSLNIRHPVNGNGLLLIHESSFNNWEWYVTSDNPIWIGLKYNGALLGGFDPANGAYSYVSDRRLKTGIRSLPSVLNKIQQLNPVQYRMKENDKLIPSSGFIAQDVEKLFPEIVSILSDNSPENKGVNDLRMLNYSQFFVLAIKAIQEQQQLISELNKEVEQLQLQKK